MSKCRSCGEELTERDVCPSCGLAPGPQTITDIFDKKKKDKPKKEKKKAKGVTCPHCNSEIPGLVDDICPMCGKGGGPQTITDIT